MLEKILRFSNIFNLIFQCQTLAIKFNNNKMIENKNKNKDILK